MVINSFIRTAHGLTPVQVEVVLSPGLSQIQILGLADKVIQESSKRIVMALNKQGFHLPPGQQAVVNLSPNSLRKTSQGLDLAIALGILLESEQISREPFDLNKMSVYGELSLTGEVSAPDDITLFNYEDHQPLLVTGPSKEEMFFPVYEAKDLRNLPNSIFKEPANGKLMCQRPPFSDDLMFDKKLARLMTIVASGEHSLLLAGDAGAGKTTLMENIVPLLRQSDEKTFRKLAKYWKLAGRDLHWRPSVQPHHSSTPLAMIGGGKPPRPGEISLAHGGALLLDELLEFHPTVQNALREPMEKGFIYVSRCGERQVYPAKALFLATTNLCRCGRFHPQKPQRCRCSSMQLRRYLERLSGPFIDRFAIFYLMNHSKGSNNVSLKQIFADVKVAQNFAQKQRGHLAVNNDLTESFLLEQLDPSVDRDWIPFTQSRRRRWSLLRVARTLADMAESPFIRQPHLEEAKEWATCDYHRLQDFRFNDLRL